MHRFAFSNQVLVNRSTAWLIATVLLIAGAGLAALLIPLLRS